MHAGELFQPLNHRTKLNQAAGSNKQTRLHLPEGGHAADIGWHKARVERTPGQGMHQGPHARLRCGACRGLSQSVQTHQ